MTNVHVQHKTERFCRDVGPIKTTLGRFRIGKETHISGGEEKSTFYFVEN